mmetsp:Transcript_38613/g.96363  ORF Transcript_38613/g.96363 Transcript_38613/m.96363 type:complete len:100 (-) Transcript_38613:105-404(-)
MIKGAHAIKRWEGRLRALLALPVYRAFEVCMQHGCAHRPADDCCDSVRVRCFTFLLELIIVVRVRGPTSTTSVSVVACTLSARAGLRVWGCTGASPVLV